MTKLPMPQGPNAIKRANALDEGIARLRAKTGAAEKRAIEGRCAITGGGFQILFERVDPRQRFTVASVQKTAPSTQRPMSAQMFTARPAHNAAEFDLRGAACPHCGSARLVYHEGCDTTYCGRTVARDASGNDLFTCPACGDTGELYTPQTMQGVSPVARAGATAPLLGRFKGMPLLGNRRK